jgi:dihydropteroate synthase
MISNYIFTFGKKEYNLASRTHIMGILNLTDDSFSDGGKYYENGKLNIDMALDAAMQMINDGADFIDVGGESTRPGFTPVPADVEIERTATVISELAKLTDIPISIDTYKSKVAEEAIKAGAEIVNDISGFKADYKMAAVTGKYQKTAIVMHIKGTITDMHQHPKYMDVFYEVFAYLKACVETGQRNRIKQIIVDPGFGFGKNLEHNVELLKELKNFKSLNCPILVGLSNKRFINDIFPTPVNDRLSGTIAANVYAAMNGANIIRVHNVIENRKAINVIDYIKNMK